MNRLDFRMEKGMVLELQKNDDGSKIDPKSVSSIEFVYLFIMVNKISECFPYHLKISLIFIKQIYLQNLNDTFFRHLTIKINSTWAELSLAQLCHHLLSWILQFLCFSSYFRIKDGNTVFSIGEVTLPEVTDFVFV